MDDGCGVGEGDGVDGVDIGLVVVLLVSSGFGVVVVVILALTAVVVVVDAVVVRVVVRCVVDCTGTGTTKKQSLTICSDIHRDTNIYFNWQKQVFSATQQGS